MKNEHTIYEELINLPQLEVTGVKLSKTEVEIYCQSKLEEQICPNCLKKIKKVNQKYERRVRDMDLTGRKVYLVLDSRQFQYLDCDRYFSEHYSFISENGQVTNWVFVPCSF